MQTRAKIYDNGEVAIDVGGAAARNPRQGPAHEAAHGTRSDNIIVWTSTPTVTRIELDPACLTPAARSRLGSWLHCGPRHKRIWLTYRDQAKKGHDEIVSSPVDALAAIDRRAAAIGRSAKPYLRRIGDCRTMPAHATDMQAMLDIWRNHRAGLSQPCKNALHEASAGRIIVVRQDTERGHILIGLGSGHYDYVMRWLSHNLGRSLQSSPDAAYGRATERIYSEASTRREPVYDELDCHVHWPQLGRIRHRYRRLMLPFNLDSKPVMVISTQFDETFDLRA